MNGNNYHGLVIHFVSGEKIKLDRGYDVEKIISWFMEGTEEFIVLDKYDYEKLKSNEYPQKYFLKKSSITFIEQTY
ncbi:MAG: hypothetical protein N3I35_05420 [Clostridia bacterium]|nr:hypothetical protein [Clostridia bacterium]